MDNNTKKRLGQYFSGDKLAELLVSLVTLSASDTILDPMAGIGDMLTAVVNVGVFPDKIYGIEIDPKAGKRCKNRLPLSDIHIRDAFSVKTYRALGCTVWDCIITNPPYVRYQSMDRFTSPGLLLKSSKETRQSLRDIINELTHLENDEKAFFLEIAKHYTGLADLAVPSWILCAALLGSGGKLAMVVPESWISRDYALSVRYMLLKLFNVEYVIEDLNSAWFPEAQIKTNLLVAKRVKMRVSLDELDKLTYTHIKLSESLIGDNSLVENMEYDGQSGYSAFKTFITSDSESSGNGYERKCIPLKSIYMEIASSVGFRKLLSRLNHSERKAAIYIPKEIQDILGVSISSTVLARLDAWGFNVGQGLRTGANKFFYTKLLRSEEDIDYLLTDEIFDTTIINVSKKYSLPVFRYQNELTESLVIKKGELLHRLIYIPENFYSSEGVLCDSDDVQLEKHIRNADVLTYESGGRTVRFQDLSAVKTNVKIEEGKCIRHWFMLPALAKRHMPHLCISRVNYKSKKCYFIADDNTIIDANFSTLWMDAKNEKIVFAMFALMNSTWTQSLLEAISSVMGGGALKVEASHLRSLILPAPTIELIEDLSALGKQLAGDEPFGVCDTILEIDRVVLMALLNVQDVNKQYLAIRNYLEKKLCDRKR